MNLTFCLNQIWETKSFPPKISAKNLSRQNEPFGCLNVNDFKLLTRFALFGRQNISRQKILPAIMFPPKKSYPPLYFPPKNLSRQKLPAKMSLFVV